MMQDSNDENTPPAYNSSKHSNISQSLADRQNQNVVPIGDTEFIKGNNNIAIGARGHATGLALKRAPVTGSDANSTSEPQRLDLPADWDCVTLRSASDLHPYVVRPMTPVNPFLHSPTCHMFYPAPVVVVVYNACLLEIQPWQCLEIQVTAADGAALNLEPAEPGSDRKPAEVHILQKVRLCRA